MVTNKDKIFCREYINKHTINNYDVDFMKTQYKEFVGIDDLRIAEYRARWIAVKRYIFRSLKQKGDL